MATWEYAFAMASGRHGGATTPCTGSVGPEDVPNADAGWAVAERGVGAALVVVVDPVWQRLPTGLA
jgi:hypothetical protein